MRLDAQAFAAALRAEPLQPGATGPVVEWVRQQLQSGYGPLHDDVPARFEADLQDAVRRFQRDHGLVDDGRVGPATLMALASGTPAASPARATE